MRYQYDTRALKWLLTCDVIMEKYIFFTSSKTPRIVIFSDRCSCDRDLLDVFRFLSLIMHKYWSLYTFFNVLHLIFAYRKSSITKVIEIGNGKEQKRLYITSLCARLQFFGSCTKASSCTHDKGSPLTS